MNVERPAMNSPTCEILTVSELEMAFLKKREEMQDMPGYDAVIASSGYVDTSNGRVMTTPDVLA